MSAVKKYADILTAFLIAVIVCAFLPGCEKEAPKPSPSAKPHVGVLVYRQDDPYLGLVTEAIRKNLDGKAEVEVLYAEDDQLRQNDQIDGLIQKKVDVFALNIVDPLAAAKAVDTIKKAGIPVVFFNREPDLNSIKTYAKACFVGTNAFDAGVMQGDIITELWKKHPGYDRNNDGKCQYIMIQANVENPEAVARTEYSVKQARENGLVMQQVGETLLCSWDEAQAFEAMGLLFPLHEASVELVIANNDSMALGAVKAMNKSGYNLEGGDAAKFIPVVGVDAIPPAVEAIRKGIMSATVVQDGAAMGEAVAAMVMNAVNGKDFLEGVNHAWDNSGVAIRIPYSRYASDR